MLFGLIVDLIAGRAHYLYLQVLYKGSRYYPTVPIAWLILLGIRMYTGINELTPRPPGSQKAWTRRPDSGNVGAATNQPY